MALEEFAWFGLQFKSKAQREKEAQEYAKWAFPYGDIQKDNLTALIDELQPKELSTPMFLTSYLTCKELFEKILESSESRESAADKMINDVGSYGQLIKYHEMPMLLALVLADADLDEKCEYPPADDMRVKIQELNGLRKGKDQEKEVKSEYFTQF